MSFRDKPLDQITEADLEALRIREVREGYDIEYKLRSPLASREKRNFLAAVSSFANTRGGDLILGVREEAGVAKEIAGLEITDADAEILRLESLTRECIEPRITGVRFHSYRLATLRNVVIARVPRSWAAPHAVVFEKHWRFYGRNSAGKYPLDVGQLRNAFRLSETTAERVRGFRVDRLSKLLAGGVPVPGVLVDGPKFVLHLIPFGAFDMGAAFDLSQLPNDPDVITGIYDYRDWRFNLDGFLIHNLTPDGRSNAYSQFYTNGSIETVLCLHAVESTKRLEIVAFEGHLIKTVVPGLMAVQKRLGVSTPLVMMLSIWGVMGYRVSEFSQRGPKHPVHGIDRDPLIIPETVVEEFEANPGLFMRPMFNAIWNACGWSRAMTYDEKGQWIGKWPK